MGQIAIALQAYQNVNQRYPQNLEELVSSRDLKSVPVDPRGGQYTYLTSSDNSSAAIYANLEAEKTAFAVWCWRSEVGIPLVLNSASECKP
ncbi:hypothetical protein HYU92_01790 [Candidatus Curtissbacteria bacterium]|nr:hypothetical protein [Candidatus Curtissbacteria bacterium]